MEAIEKLQGRIKTMAEKPTIGITIPQGFIVGFLLFLIAQTSAGIWWASKLDATLNFTVSSIQAQKAETDLKIKGLESDLKEQKEKIEVQNLTIQLLQVKVGVIEGRRK